MTGQPITYRQWGTDLDANALQQMENACRLPVSVAAALMPDAHVGYDMHEAAREVANRKILVRVVKIL